MPVQLILAISENDVIGIDGQLPWHIPFDMQWFKMNTYAGAIIMGRKTWDSLPRKPLPGRLNIVLSRSMMDSDDCICCQHWSDALAVAQECSYNVYIIGGGDIYNQALLLKIVDTLIITRVHQVVTANNLTYCMLPLYKTKAWQSSMFQYKTIPFHFELYTVNKFANQTMSKKRITNKNIDENVKNDI